MPDKNLRYAGGSAQPVYAPHLEFLRGYQVPMTGASVNQAIPDGAQVFQIRPEGGSLWYSINVAPASALSHGYVPRDFVEIVGPLTNLSALYLFGTGAGTIAHVLFFRENQQ